MKVYALALLTTGIMFLATTLGALFVFLIKKMNPLMERICLGLASGIMIAASIFSLIMPALEEGNSTFVVISILLGGLFIWLIDFLFAMQKKKKRSLFFLAVTLHNIPEGMVVGLACALSYQAGSAVTLASAIALAVGIAIQNIPEGMAVSFTMLEKNKSRLQSFFYGMISGIVEPIFGVFMVLLSSQLQSWMFLFLSIAAGAMFYVVADELIPQTKEENTCSGAVFFMIGFCIMMYLDILLG